MNLTIPQILTAHKEAANTSHLADIWTEANLDCNGWTVYDPTYPRVHLPWHDGPHEAPYDVQTAFPILFMTNSLDPVSPRYAAFKMAGKFNDSRLLEQRAAGHTTLSAISTCTAKVVRDYVRDGKLPPTPRPATEGGWMVCEGDGGPWRVAVRDERSVDDDEVQLVRAFKTLQRG